MTIAWTTVLALTFVALFPSIYGFVRSGRWKEDGLVAYFGLYEEWQTKGYAQVAETNPKERPIRSTTPKFVLGSVAIFQKISRTTLRLPSILTRLPFLRPQRSEVSCHPSQSFLPFSLGSLFLALLIPIFVFSTLFPGSQLVANPNRFGFFALGLLPPLFILSSNQAPSPGSRIKAGRRSTSSTAGSVEWSFSSSSCMRISGQSPGLATSRRSSPRLSKYREQPPSPFYSSSPYPPPNRSDAGVIRSSSFCTTSGSSGSWSSSTRIRSMHEGGRRMRSWRFMGRILSGD